MTPAVEPPFVAETETYIPKGTIAVREGAKVVTNDGKHIGNVEQVFTSPASNRATHFLVSKGLLVKERKLIPGEWVESFSENELRLAVSNRTIEQLPHYEYA